MISYKTLIAEIKAVKKEQKDLYKKQDWPELARGAVTLETLEFVRDWNDKR